MPKEQHQHPFNGPLFGTTQLSQYPKGKANLDLLEQETVSGSSTISCALPQKDNHTRIIASKMAPINQQIDTLDRHTQRQTISDHKPKI